MLRALSEVAAWPSRRTMKSLDELIQLLPEDRRKKLVREMLGLHEDGELEKLILYHFALEVHASEAVWVACPPA